MTLIRHKRRDRPKCVLEQNKQCKQRPSISKNKPLHPCTWARGRQFETCLDSIPLPTKRKNVKMKRKYFKNPCPTYWIVDTVGYEDPEEHLLFSVVPLAEHYVIAICSVDVEVNLTDVPWVKDAVLEHLLVLARLLLLEGVDAQQTAPDFAPKCIRNALVRPRAKLLTVRKVLVPGFEHLQPFIQACVLLIFYLCGCGSREG